MTESTTTSSESQVTILPVEYFIDTGIDVDQTISDVERFRAGEIVESRLAVPIALIHFDPSELAAELGKLGYHSTDSRASLLVDIEAGKEVVVNPARARFGYDLKSLSPSQQERLISVMGAFAEVVATDRSRNNLGYSPGPYNDTISVEIALGHYNNQRIVTPHTDTAPEPRVKYTASFGTESTGYIACQVQSNHTSGGFDTELSPAEARAAGAQHAPEGTVERFVLDRDVHFAPIGDGFRVFLSTELKLEPPVS